jgi:hypothetical protein
VGQDSNLQPGRYERVESDMVAGIGWCAEEGVSDPKLIQSALSRTVREDGTEVRIDIYRLETTDWSLEVVDETGTSTVWDDLFPTDQAALDEALKTIREEGIGTFVSGKTDITKIKNICNMPRFNG